MSNSAFARHSPACAGMTSQDQRRFARCAAEFISLMSVKEAEPRKTLCAKGKSGKSTSRGFFERASCLRRKTPHIPVRRPPGLQAARWRPDIQKLKKKQKGTAAVARLSQRMQPRESRLKPLLRGENGAGQGRARRATSAAVCGVTRHRSASP